MFVGLAESTKPGATSGSVNPLLTNAPLRLRVARGLAPWTWQRQREAGAFVGLHHPVRRRGQVFGPPSSGVDTSCQL